MATSGFPNHLPSEGPDWSADLMPMGPGYTTGFPYTGQSTQMEDAWSQGDVSQYDPGDLYKGLPDIAVPKNKVN